MLPMRQATKADMFSRIALASVMVGVGMIVVLARLCRHLRAEPRGGLGPGRHAARSTIIGATLIGWGMAIGGVFGPLLSILADELGVMLVIAGALMWCMGLVVFYATASSNALQTLQRAGVVKRRLMLEEAAAALPPASVVLVPFAAFGVVPWSAVVGVALVGVTLAAAGLALRCARVRLALGRVVVERDRAHV